MYLYLFILTKVRPDTLLLQFFKLAIISLQHCNWKW